MPPRCSSTVCSTHTPGVAVPVQTSSAADPGAAAAVVDQVLQLTADTGERCMHDVLANMP